MVVTPDPGLGQYLTHRLSAARFEVIDIRPGPAFVEAVYRATPDIAVLDGIEERNEATQLEIALLKKRRPDVQVIAVSDRSSVKDASIVEQGVFYYSAGHPRCDLVRLISAAAKTDGNKRD